MKVFAFNGSPRKTWNTAALLNKALEGAASAGAETKLIHLYDLDFKGCVSCFSCKLKGGPSYGRCAVKDDLAPVLKELEEADAIILGSPVYFGNVSGEMRSFMERLLFPYLRYSDPPQSLCSKKINAGFICTLGATEDQAKAFGFEQSVGMNERLLKMIFGNAQTLLSFDTYQFEDYSKVDAGRFDPEKKAQRREEVFPEDCNKAFEMGQKLVRP